MKRKERRRNDGEGERAREDRRKCSGRTARRRPWPVIYIESYLHLNVFIFNARPRNGLSALGGFVSAPHLRRPHAEPFTCFCLALFRSPLKITPFARSKETTGTAKARKCISSDAFSPLLPRWSGVRLNFSVYVSLDL